MNIVFKWIASFVSAYTEIVSALDRSYWEIEIYSAAILKLYISNMVNMIH